MLINALEKTKNLLNNYYKPHLHSSSHNHNNLRYLKVIDKLKLKQVQVLVKFSLKHSPHKIKLQPKLWSNQISMLSHNSSNNSHNFRIPWLPKHLWACNNNWLLNRLWLCNSNRCLWEECHKLDQEVYYLNHSSSSNIINSKTYKIRWRNKEEVRLDLTNPKDLCKLDNLWIIN